MAAQLPFDPGDLAPHLTTGDEELQSLTAESITEQNLQAEDSFQWSEVYRGRSITFPYLYNPNLGHPQHAQAPCLPVQFLVHPVNPPYSLQTESYSQQAYDLPAPLQCGSEGDGVFATHRLSAPAGRRNSVPAGYHSYHCTTGGYRTHGLQGQPLTPTRREFGQRNAPLHCMPVAMTGSSPHATSTKENVPPLVAAGNGLFMSDPLIQAVVPAFDSPPRPTPRPTLSGVQASPVGSIRPRILSNESDGPSQGRQIWNLRKPYSVITQSAYDVFNEEQCAKILWLALHGIPSRAIAYLLTIGSDAIRLPGGKTKKQFVATLSDIVQRFVPELATGQHGKEEPDALIQRLLDRGDSLFWSPFLLKHAIDYTFISEDDDDGARKERKRNATERRSVPGWMSNHADSPIVGTFHRHNRKAMTALGGVLRQASEQEIIEEHFGYRENNHDVEKVLMKEWLLKIQELGSLPDFLDRVDVTA